MYHEMRGERRSTKEDDRSEKKYPERKNVRIEIVTVKRPSYHYTLPSLCPPGPT
jgi:hypothetical protein